MIYNVWSTPRTGSVWYSIKLLIDLRKKYPEAQLLSEIFNPYHLNIYKLQKSESILNLTDYQEGAFFEEYSINKNKELVKEKIYSQRKRSSPDEEEYRLKLVKDLLDLKIPLVIHNHVAPMNPAIYQFLQQEASCNIYMGRRNILEQVSSYCVAYASKVFAQFSDENVSEKMSNIQVDVGVVKNLLSRIAYWDQLDKSRGEVVYYEDIDFGEHQEFKTRLPRKQNLSSAMNKLSPASQRVIEELVREYYLKSNRT